MLMTPERRHSERARIPCHIPVELTDAARAAQFEADAVDLSVGGLSLRAAQLPSIGSQLFCTFEAMPGGAQILGRGEVVWSQPAGEGGGEFGLRFIEVDARNQALIDEMVAERIARITPREKPTEPVLATLEIENFDEPMTARLVHEGETHALFEQPLTHFAVGKAVIAHAGASLVRGHVASLEVRMEGTTPRLLINLEIARDSSHFGEFMWGEPGSDTDPDVFAQTEAYADQAQADAEQARAEDDELEDESEDEEDLDDEDEEDEGAEDEDDEDVPPALELHEEEAARSGTLAGIGAPLPAPILARKDQDAQQLPLFRRETPRSENPRATTPELGNLHLDTSPVPQERPSYAPDDVYMDEQRAQQLLASERPPAPYDDDASLEEVHAVSLAASQQYAAGEHNEDDTETVATDGPLMRVLGVFARVTEGVQSGKERAREWAAGIREDAGSRVTGNGRLFGPKPRRVTSSIQREGDPGKHNLRVIAIGSLCILALVAFAYALTPSSEEPIPHHDVRGDQAGDPSGLEAETETTEDNALAAASGEPALPRGEPAPAEKAIPARAAAPRVEQVSADKRPTPKPSSSLISKAPPAPPPPAAAPSAVGSMSFGQKQVPNARRFLIRMSEPVKTLLGKENADGFSVVIMGNTALDKAAPIAAGHPGVAHAAILNRRGDHSAELNVQFSPGKTPAYRVSGQGSTLEVQIEQ